MPVERSGTPRNVQEHAGHSTQFTAAHRAHIAAHTVPHTTARMAGSGSSSWGALRGRVSQPTTLAPDDKVGREGLHAFVNITDKGLESLVSIV